MPELLLLACQQTEQAAATELQETSELEPTGYKQQPGTNQL